MDKQAISSYLEDKKQQLEQRIGAIQADFQKGRSQDFAEQTTESENDEVLSEIQHEAAVELKQINEAIQRLESGRYGSCSSCDEPIQAERLSALPYTTTCIKCAQ